MDALPPLPATAILRGERIAARLAWVQWTSFVAVLIVGTLQLPLEKQSVVGIYRRAALAWRAGDPVVVVSDEIGLGMVPMHAGSRAFRDLVGLVHQRFAAEADQVLFVVAGLPLTLKPAHPA